MSDRRDNHERLATDDPSAPRPRREPRKGIDINELPIWTWVGILFGVVVIGLGLWMMTRNGSPGEAAQPTAVVEPTAQATGAPQQVQPQATAQPPAAGVAPTATSALVPTSTPPLPERMRVGIRVVVAGTGEDRLRVRAGPGTDYATMTIVSDGTEFTVLEGPQSQGGFEWWRLEMADGTVGWAVGTYLVPIGS